MLVQLLANIIRDYANQNDTALCLLHDFLLFAPYLTIPDGRSKLK